MSIVYKYRLDADYYRTVIARYYRQQPFFLKLPVQFGLLSILFIVMYLSVTRQASTAWMDNLGFSLMGGLLIFVSGIVLTKWGIFLRFKHRADFGTEVTATMTDEGVVAYGEHTQGTWKWSAYPKATRYSDGILLARSGAIRWLPDAAIRSGDPDEATALVGSKSELRRLDI